MVGSGFPHPCGGVQLLLNWTNLALFNGHLIVSWGRTDLTCWMERGQGTRLNLYAQRCTLSSIGFSVFSLCLYVLGFLKNPIVNKSSYFYGSHCLLHRVFVPATPFYQATSHKSPPLSSSSWVPLWLGQGLGCQGEPSAQSGPPDWEKPLRSQQQTDYR